MRSAGTGLIRAAVVGCGLIGDRRAGVIRNDAGAELVVVADVELRRARAVADRLACDATADWHAAVARRDIDAVVVSTSNDALASIAQVAIAQGKHVLIEKPMARTVDEATAVVQLAATHGCVVGVGFNHRLHPAMLEAHRRFTGGTIGEVLFLRCRYGHGGRPGYEREWRTDRGISGGGELLDQGVHALDLFRWFAGDFTEASGFLATYVWSRSKSGAQTAGGDNVEDNAFAHFRSADGVIASVHASWTQWKNLFSFEVFGREGYLIVEGLGGSYGPETLTWGRRRPESGPPDEHKFTFAPDDDSWRLQWQDFVAAVREKRAPLASGHDGLQAMRMVHAVYRAAETGSVVPV